MKMMFAVPNVPKDVNYLENRYVHVIEKLQRDIQLGEGESLEITVYHRDNCRVGKPKKTVCNCDCSVVAKKLFNQKAVEGMMMCWMKHVYKGRIIAQCE